MANLEVGIGADISDLLSGIDKAEKEIKKLQKQQEILVKANLDTSGLDAKIKDSKANLEKLRGALNQTSDSFSQAKKPMGDASNTLTNFSRIAQDAPFGIIGIGNNLTATAEAFGALSKSSGGAGNALKALGASLAGPGGVLFAVSLVTTALTVMSQQGITVGDVFNKLTGNFDQFKKDLADITKEATESGKAQAASVGAYVSAAKNINLSMHDRLIAVQKLQDEYPGYFGNLSKEQILNGDVSLAVKEVTKALIARAKAQSFSEKIATLAGEELALREKETIAIQRQHDAVRALGDAEAKALKFPGNESFANAFARAGTELRAANNALKYIQDPLRANVLEQRKWTDEINKSTAASIKLDEKTPKTLKAPKIKREDISGIDNFLKPNGGKNPFKDAIKSLSDDLKTDKTIGFADALNTQRINLLKQYGSFLTDVSADVIKMNEQISALLESSLSNTFGGIGEVIGNSLANGGNIIESLGKTLLSSVGSVLVELGKLAIATGVGLLGIKTALTTLNPAAAIAAGVALVALGSAVSSKANAIGNSSGGGKGTSNVSAGNSVSSPTSSVTTSSYSGGFSNVVFEISGQSLVGVLSNTLNKNVKLGGVPAI